MNIREVMAPYACELFEKKADQVLSYYPESITDPEKIKIIMINEIVADEPSNDFYSSKEDAAYLQTTIPLFQKAGFPVKTMEDITNHSIYITNAVKLPKTETKISNEQLLQSLPLLEKELGCFPNVQAIMLNGDVAKKAYNKITKKSSGKNAVPAVSTYKLRHNEIYFGDIRIFPAYIMTGKNVLIEKSKVEMTAEDIAKMIDYIS